MVQIGCMMKGDIDMSVSDHEEKKRDLFNRQKEMLDLFLQNGAISAAQHDKSLHDLIEKMDIKDNEEYHV